MRNLIFILIFLFTADKTIAQDIYLFCYFKGGGDGLHYAYSEDGFKWTAMFNDSVVLKPEVSRDKLFRDPCIVKAPDGTYHMVWTVSWADKGIGYASSKDLVNWSQQQFLPVMAHEDSAKNTWAPEINYDHVKKQFIIYWASTVAGKFPQHDTSAEGRKYNHRMYYVTTKDFKKFSKAKIL
jgi:beta-xylosidase